MTTNMSKKQIQDVLDKYKALSFSKKEKVFNAMSEQFEKAENDNGKKIDRVEKNLTRALVKNWNTTSNKAIRQALRLIPKNEKRFTQKTFDKILASLDKSYKGVEKKTAKRVKNDIEEIYKTEKVRFASQFKLTQKKGKKKRLVFTGLQLQDTQKIKSGKIIKKVVEVDYRVKSVNMKKLDMKVFKAVTFGVVDAEAYVNLARLENVAIGDHFEKTLKPRVSKSIQTGVMDKGLTNAESSLFLQQELTGTLGGNISGALPASVAKGQASVNAYFEMVTATNTTYAKNFAHINLSNEAGITQLIFNAILDRVTSKVCEQMHGRVFTIKQALTLQEKVLGAANVGQLQSFAPFQRNLSSFKLDTGKKLTDPASSEALAKAGIIVPPLHGRCRSELQPA